MQHHVMAQIKIHNFHTSIQTHSNFNLSSLEHIPTANYLEPQKM